MAFCNAVISLMIQVEWFSGSTTQIAHLLFHVIVYLVCDVFVPTCNVQNMFMNMLCILHMLLWEIPMLLQKHYSNRDHASLQSCAFSLQSVYLQSSNTDVYS